MLALVPDAHNGGGATRDGDSLPSMVAIDTYGETETETETEPDAGSELDTSPSPRKLHAAPQSRPVAGDNGGPRGVKSDEPGSAAAAAGSSQSTEALSPRSAASFPPRAVSSSSSLAAVDSALSRVFRLRELLRSVGEAKAWARLLGGDGHLGCRRLADLALSSSKAVVLQPRKGYSDAAAAAAATRSVPGRLDGPCRRLCSAALGCLAMCGRISPGVWADLAYDDDDDDDGGGGSTDQDLSGSGGGGDGGGSKLTRLLSLALSLAESNETAAVAATGLNEHEYFFGKGTGGAGSRRQGEREEGEGEEEEENEEEEEPELCTMGLAMIYEILAGE